MSPEAEDRAAAEDRFSEVFAHLGLITLYARRRGAADPEEIAAEAMMIAWRRLADVPRSDPRPWLIATARNLMLADHRSRRSTVARGDEIEERAVEPAPIAVELDPKLEHALRTLSPQDREALLLVAWEDLSPSLAAASLGISAVAFRVRLHRARRRLIDALGAHQPLRVETSPPSWEQS